MSMRNILIVARKEINGIMKSKIQLLVGILLSLWFGAVSGLMVNKGTVSLDSILFYLTILLGIFVAYSFSGYVFLREKKDGIIESLLCTPLSLRQIWFGKVMSVTFLAYMASLLSVAVIILTANITSTSRIFPSPAIILHIVSTVPIFIAAAVGMMSFVQFLMGMRENQIANFLIFFLIFFALFFTFNIGKSLMISGIEVGILLAIGIILLLITNYLARYLSKERIITTIT